MADLRQALYGVNAVRKLIHGRNEEPLEIDPPDCRDAVLHSGISACAAGRAASRDLLDGRRTISDKRRQQQIAEQ
jgi:hypothetical protein